MSVHVVNEAKRCLNCKNPFCRKGCPIATSIPEVIQKFLNGKIDEAGEILLNNNPLSMICSLICDHEKQCEGNCVLNHKGQPVHISSIENYIASRAFDRLNPIKPQSNHMKVAIVGSGPAGITISLILAQKGYDVTVFEAKEKIGGVLRYGIPSFRLPKDILDELKEKMQKLGIRIRPNIAVGKSITIEEMFRDGYQAVFLGTGVWSPKKLGIKGETLGNVHFAIDYLVNPNAYDLGKKVIVIGAGNSAMDVSRTALRNGSDVHVFARRSQIAASQREIDYALIDGVKFHYQKAPVEICDDGVIFKDTYLDENGKVVMIEGSEKKETCDSVIVAVSQGPDNIIASTTKNLDVQKGGLFHCDELGHTSVEGVFACGDAVKGARTVVEAVAQAKIVAETMDRYCQNK